MHRTPRAFVLTFALLALFYCLPAGAAVVLPDVVTVGTVTASSGIVNVPVYIQDRSGTPLGLDQPPGSRIQSYSIKVNYSPASAVSSVTFTRAGITAPLTPLSEFTPASAGAISLLDTFQESTNLVPYTLDGAVPGNQVANLHFMLSPTVTPGTVITLTLDSTLTQLANEDGTMKETTTLNTLALVNGSITVPVGFVYDIPALSTWFLILLAASLAIIAIRMRG
jgi:hypothetical protein